MKLSIFKTTIKSILAFGMLIIFSSSTAYAAGCKLTFGNQSSTPMQFILEPTTPNWNLSVNGQDAVVEAEGGTGTMSIVPATGVESGQPKTSNYTFKVVVVPQVSEADPVNVGTVTIGGCATSSENNYDWQIRYTGGIISHGAGNALVVESYHRTSL